MRLFSLRSCIYGSLAIIASMFLFHSAFASMPLAPGCYMSVATDHQVPSVLVQPSDHVAIVETRFEQTVSHTDRSPSVIMPEYLASYETNAQSFIQLHRRC